MAVLGMRLGCVRSDWLESRTGTLASEALPLRGDLGAGHRVPMQLHSSIVRSGIQPVNLGPRPNRGCSTKSAYLSDGSVIRAGCEYLNSCCVRTRLGLAF